MVVGSHPYQGMLSAEAVHHKISSRDSQVSLPDEFTQSRDPIIQDWVKIIEDCTRFDRHSRITAEMLVDALKELEQKCIHAINE